MKRQRKPPRHRRKPKGQQREETDRQRHEELLVLLNVVENKLEETEVARGSSRTGRGPKGQ